MIVYFTASIVGKKHYLANYQRIIEIFTKKGHKILSDHIINSTEDQIRMETREEREKFHRNLEKWINSCDLMVAEVSFPSISVGYEISMALHKGKPVLVLFTNGDPPSLLDEYCNEKLIVEKYKTEDLAEIIEDFIRYSDSKNDTRFTFFITPEMAGHLSKMGQKQRMPKAVYLRRLLQKDILNQK